MCVCVCVRVCVVCVYVCACVCVCVCVCVHSPQQSSCPHRTARPALVLVMCENVDWDMSNLCVRVCVCVCVSMRVHMCIFCRIWINLGPGSHVGWLVG